MSFMLTMPQFLNRTKDVTRRLGWDDAKVGDLLQGVEKGQGLKKGEKVVKLGTIRIVSVRREQLDRITDADCAREGFPNMRPAEFIEMFRQHNRCDADALVNRIEYEYVDGGHA